MASYSTMNTIPAADVSETPLLQRDVKINAKTLVGGAALAAFVLGALAATAVDLKAPVRSTAFSTWVPSATDLDPSEFAQLASGIPTSHFEDPIPAKIYFGDLEKKHNVNVLEMEPDVFSYDSDDNTFVWKRPPFAGGDDNTAVYNIDKDTLADQGLYKLWRDGSGGYFTVSLENYGGHHPQYFLQFLCIKNDTEKDPSDQC